MTLWRVQLAPSEPRHMVRVIAEAATDQLESWIGQGELDGRRESNNRSPHIERWRQLDGTGGPVSVTGDWCAVVQCAADLVAVARLGGGYRLPWAPSRGAKRYARNVADSGGTVAARSRGLTRGRVDWLLPPEQVPRGAVIAWHRGGWRGHVERWTEYDPASDTLTTIGGNRNNRRDRHGRYAVVDYHIRRRGSWRENLAIVVVPWAQSSG